jgi:copper chaperone
MSGGEHVYEVLGMTCEHCVAAVKAEVASLPGAEAAEVDLASGKLVVRGDVSAEAVRSAIETAGYSLETNRTTTALRP